jgi:hypothetical protein
MSQFNDDLIPLSQARRRFGAKSKSTLLRYYHEGVMSKITGKRCFLELEQNGNYFEISEAMWRRLQDELNGRGK